MNLSSLFRPSLIERRAWTGFEFEGATKTFGELDAEANRLARLFLAKGLTPGDRVAVFLPNCPALVAIYLAAVKTGFIFTPINILYRPAEVTHILDDAEPRVLFTTQESGETLSSVLATRPQTRTLSIEAIPEQCAGYSGEALDIAPAEKDIAALVYTSGTTGRPKGAMLTQANFAANALNLIDAWRMTCEDRLLLSLPLFHVHGLGNGLHTWLALGYHLRLVERFRKETILDEFRDFRPTVFFGVPTMYERLIEAPPKLAREIGGFVRLFVSGSAPLPEATLERFRDRFGHDILERYGMSETLMNTSNPYEGERRAGSVGLPLPNVSIRICNPDSSGEVGLGESGELQIKGPNVFPGYWRRPDATAGAFTPDGYFRSGDLGARAEDGYIALLGRSRELIICGGFNVYPREVEEFLAQLPGVEQAAVVGVPDGLKGEVPVAYVVLAGDAEPAELEPLCREGLASFKVPKRFVRVPSLPRNALGKVQKHLLREKIGDKTETSG